MNTIEHHPFEPFLPINAKMLMLGSFPPAEKRWTMPFYYPNYINDMWRIFGIVFLHNKEDFVAGLLRQIPLCKALVTTGEKATKVLQQLFNITKTPKVGQFVTFTFEGRTLKLYRMPSSSRAYPMKIERKAEFYKPMLLELLNNNNPI